MREHNYCYFHRRWHRKGMQVNKYLRKEQPITLPALRDANSIQSEVAKVVRQLEAQIIDHKTAALLLYALQIASSNLEFTSFEPEQPTQVVIDRDCVAHRPLGASAWSKVEGRSNEEYGAPGVPARPEECL